MAFISSDGRVGDVQFRLSEPFPASVGITRCARSSRYDRFSERVSIGAELAGLGRWDLDGISGGIWEL